MKSSFQVQVMVTSEEMVKRLRSSAKAHRDTASMIRDNAKNIPEGEPLFNFVAPLAASEDDAAERNEFAASHIVPDTSFILGLSEVLAPGNVYVGAHPGNPDLRALLNILGLSPKQENTGKAPAPPTPVIQDVLALLHGKNRK